MHCVRGSKPASSELTQGNGALSGAKHIPAGQMEIGISAESSPADLGGRRPLERSVLAQVARGTFLGCWFESQQGLECPTMHYAMAGVALRLKTERVEIWTPGARHSSGSGACAPANQLPERTAGRQAER